MQEAGAEVDPGGRRWCRHPRDGLPPGLCQADPGRAGRWNSFPRRSVMTAYDSSVNSATEYQSGASRKQPGCVAGPVSVDL